MLVQLVPVDLGTFVHIEEVTELVVEYVRAMSNPIGAPIELIIETTLLTGLGMLVQLFTLGLLTFVQVVVMLESPTANL